MIRMTSLYLRFYTWSLLIEFALIIVSQFKVWFTYVCLLLDSVLRPISTLIMQSALSTSVVHIYMVQLHGCPFPSLVSLHSFISPDICVLWFASAAPVLGLYVYILYVDLYVDQSTIHIPCLDSSVLGCYILARTYGGLILSSINLCICESILSSDCGHAYIAPSYSLIHVEAYMLPQVISLDCYGCPMFLCLLYATAWPVW